MTRAKRKTKPAKRKAETVPPLRLEWRSASELAENPANWRRHPETQLGALAGALKEVGWAGACLYNETTGRLIDGHARKKLAKNGEKIPVLVGRWTPEQESTILATLDPLAAMATADATALEALLKGIQVGDEALLAMLAELAAANPILPALPEAGGGGDDFDTTPTDGPTRTRRGDLWVIGGVHRLLVGDCTNEEDVRRVMGGERADAVITDPPYGMNLDTDWSSVRGSMRAIAHGTAGNTYPPVVGDSEPYDPSPLFTNFGYCSEFFLFGADYYAERIPDRNAGSWMVWDKRKDSQSEAIGSEFELIWSKAHHKRRVLRHDWFGFLSSRNGSDARNRQHPTQKPVSLIADIIEQWAGGKLIADPFLGSGTTLIAAHRLGRRCYGLEIEPRYADVILKRAEAEGLTCEKVP